jgi:hypothetical protein
MDNQINSSSQVVNNENTNNTNYTTKKALKNTNPSDQPNRITKRRQSDISKKVMFDINVNRTPSRVLTQKEVHPILFIDKSTSTTNQNEVKRFPQRKRYNSVKFQGQILFAEKLVEIIDGQGNISKEKVKGDKGKDDFSINRNKKMEGEFKKAEEFYLQNKDKNETDDIDEEIKTNTVRNQFVGKLNVIDSGIVRAPLKKEES